MRDELVHVYGEISYLMGVMQRNMDKHMQKGTKIASRRARVASNKLTKLFKEYRRLSAKIDNEK